MKSFLRLALAGVLALTFGISSASAFTYDLTTPNSDISGSPPNYGTVAVSLVDSTHASITFTSDLTHTHAYMFIAAQALDLNTNGAVSVGPISTSSFPGFNTPTFGSAGSGQVDGFGNFNLTLDASDGYKDAFHIATFTLTKSSGSWSSDTDVLTENNLGLKVAAHIAVANTVGGTPVQSDGASATGFASNGFPVPEPATTAMLLGFAIPLGLYTWRRSRQRLV